MSEKERKDQHIGRMADMLRQGAILTELACPACASPLFKLRSGSLWCANCEKKVIVVRNGEEPTKIQSSMVLEDLEMTLLVKVQQIRDKMQHEEDVDELRKLGDALSELLENIEKIRRVNRA